jgi:glycine dehydrogenase
MFMKKLTLKTL